MDNQEYADRLTETAQDGIDDQQAAIAFVETVRATTGATGSVNHVPLPMLRLMSLILRPIKPVLAGQMAASVVMDTRDMTADTTERARRYPRIPSTPLRDVAARQFRPAPGVSTGRPPVTQP